MRIISEEISKLADNGSKHSKKLKKSVDDIGDALRSPIEVPKGVRGIQNAPMQQYIQQQLTSPPPK